MTRSGVPLCEQLADGLRLREANPSDLDGLFALEAGFPPVDRFPRATWARVLAGNAVVLVIEVEASAEIIGALGLLFHKQHKTARIYSLTIAQAWQGRGLSHTMVEAAQHVARHRGRRRIRLEVRATNRAAISLYEKHGYTVFGRSAGWFGDGEDAFLMEKIISPDHEGAR